MTSKAATIFERPMVPNVKNIIDLSHTFLNYLQSTEINNFIESILPMPSDISMQDFFNTTYHGRVQFTSINTRQNTVCLIHHKSSSPVPCITPSTSMSTIDINLIFQDDFFDEDPEQNTKITNLIKTQYAKLKLRQMLIDESRELFDAFNAALPAPDPISRISIKKLMPFIGVRRLTNNIYSQDTFVPNIPNSFPQVRFDNSNISKYSNNFKLTENHKNTIYQFLRRLVDISPTKWIAAFKDRYFNDENTGLSIQYIEPPPAFAIGCTDIKTHRSIIINVLLRFTSNIGNACNVQDILPGDIIIGRQKNNSTASFIVNPLSIKESKKYMKNSPKHQYLTPQATKFMKMCITYSHENEIVISNMFPVECPSDPDDNSLEAHAILTAIHGDPFINTMIWTELENSPQEIIAYIEKAVKNIIPNPNTQTIVNAYYN